MGMVCLWQLLSIVFTAYSQFWCEIWYQYYTHFTRNVLSINELIVVDVVKHAVSFWMPWTNQKPYFFKAQAYRSLLLWDRNKIHMQLFHIRSSSYLKWTSSLWPIRPHPGIGHVFCPLTLLPFNGFSAFTALINLSTWLSSNLWNSRMCRGSCVTYLSQTGHCLCGLTMLKRYTFKILLTQYSKILHYDKLE